MQLPEKNIIHPRAIGYWNSKHSPDFPDPHVFVNPNIENNQREKVIKYLISGIKFIPWLGYSFCRFECGVHESKLGAFDFTDGVYVWPEGLSHYIKEHNVWLPDEFIEHVNQNLLNDSSLIETSKIGPPDFSWWKNFK